MKETKSYDSAEIEIVKIATPDVIATSGWNLNNGEGNSDSNGWT